MDKMRLLGVVLVFAMIVGAAGWRNTQAQTDEQYFEQTGHRVSGEFLDAYLSASNPGVVFGYPITDAFLDKNTNLLIQYFERARFELHPDESPGQRVRISPLGEYLYVPGQTLPAGPQAACRTFSDTGHRVCYSFLEFFDANGGVRQFGLPISNLELQDGRMVQYFQRGRFEWRPELPPGQRVRLADLGRQYFYVRGEDPGLLTGNTGGEIINGPVKGILTLNARAYPSQAVTARKGQQSVYVTVFDQRLLPVENAKVTLLVRLPSGEEKRYEAEAPTDKNGIARVSFPFNSAQIGTALVRAFVQRENLNTETTTSFRLWW